MIALTILSVILIAAISALATKFIEHLIGDPWDDHQTPSGDSKVNQKAILSFIGLWIVQGYEKREREIQQLLSGVKIEKRLYQAVRQKNLFMAIGACYYCLNFYVTLVLCSFAFYQFDLSYWNLLYALPVSHFVIGWVME